jgi:hypothetical protein
MAGLKSGMRKAESGENTMPNNITFTARTTFHCPNCTRLVRIGDTIRWFDTEQGTYQHDECPSARESRRQSPKQACGGELEKLQGVVEVDEAFFGGKEANKHEHKKLNAGRGSVGKSCAIVDWSRFAAP